tara:strand:- start:376 stop:951 length:576 start_codon:yes stop_codon:yes gene_type:complete
MKDKDSKSQSRKHEKQREDELWTFVTRDVERIERNVGKSDAPKSQTKLHRDPSIPREKVIFHEAPKIKNAPSSMQVDHRTSEKLRRGKIVIEGRLDLHGMTQNEAYDALLHFIPRMQAQGKRCVLVITGKGMRQYAGDPSSERTIGVLRQKAPEWLGSSPLNQYVLKVQEAQKKHGAEGAIYVLLRRHRDT